MAPADAGSTLCRRCNENEVTHTIRSEPTCGPCYRRYVQMKAIKRLEAASKEIRAVPTRTKKVLVGLSFGVSSSSLIHMLDESANSQLKKRPTPAYDPVVVHVETEMSGRPSSSPSQNQKQKLLDKFIERYPRLTFRSIPLTTALDLETIDWSSLPAAPGDSGEEPEERLHNFFARLPSTTSRADILRLFVRHILISTALSEGCHALFLGCSTTALAALTLGETAKGRGFTLPWMINDGPQPVHAFTAPVTPTGAGSDTRAQAAGREVARLPIYYPLREVFRNELVEYAGLVSPPITDLVLPSGAAAPGAAVVSHKDVSIDDVMTRYFDEVEASYPSIVANVVRTTAKLERLGVEGDDMSCGLCGMGLDELGDERWKGEIGDVDAGEYGRLCYGCQRSMRN